MAFPTTSITEERDRLVVPRPPVELNSPGAVSWGAIAAGAAAAAALSLILLMLGVGLGLSSVSPWAREGVGTTTLGVSTILWVTLTQLLASAMGGYLAGRLRSRWTEVHGDEVYFRDTAHGFLAWAVASLATAAMLTSAVASILGGSVQAGASMAAGMSHAAGSAVAAAAGPSRPAQGAEGGPMGYFVDSLFRRDGASPGADSATANSDNAAEVARIFMNTGGAGPLPPDDVRRVGQIVAQRTGLSQEEAEKRVVDVQAKAQARLNEADAAAREAADKARKASAYGSLWLFVSLLIGAFFASLCATFGGRRRDA